MAKGKHPPSAGAIREDKVLHPLSRKVKKLSKQETHRFNQDKKLKTGAARIQVTGEKLSWFKENLPAIVEDPSQISPEEVLSLVRGFLSRFEDELSQIKLKRSIGGKGRKQQHSSREDAINLAIKIETEEFEGCGLEMVDWFDPDNLNYFLNWDGELRFVQNIKLKKFTRKDLEARAGSGLMETL